jgi:hypothetical protein
VVDPVVGIRAQGTHKGAYFGLLRGSFLIPQHGGMRIAAVVLKAHPEATHGPVGCVYRYLFDVGYDVYPVLGRFWVGQSYRDFGRFGFTRYY